MDFVFPGETHVTWTVMIVLYRTSPARGRRLHRLLALPRLRPCDLSRARFSLASAFVFLLFATAPLLIHLGQPQRAFTS